MSKTNYNFQYTTTPPKGPDPMRVKEMISDWIEQQGINKMPEIAERQIDTEFERVPGGVRITQQISGISVSIVLTDRQINLLDSVPDKGANETENDAIAMVRAIRGTRF